MKRLPLRSERTALSQGTGPNTWKEERICPIKQECLEFHLVSGYASGVCKQRGTAQRCHPLPLCFLYSWHSASDTLCLEVKIFRSVPACKNILVSSGMERTLLSLKNYHKTYQEKFLFLPRQLKENGIWRTGISDNSWFRVVWDYFLLV